MDTQRIIKKAIIPAAGFGTRMLPATKSIPKELLPVAGKPMIQYAVEEAVDSGVETIVLVTRSGKSALHSHFSRDHQLECFLESRNQLSAATLVRELAQIADLRFVEQEQVMGLAHAISCAKPILGNEPFLVLLPDEIVLADQSPAAQLIGAYHDRSGSRIAVREIEACEIIRHGIARIEESRESKLDKSVRLRGLVEKPSLVHAPSRIGVFGRYLLEPEIWDAIERTSPDSMGEVQLTDALDLLCRECAVFGFFFDGIHYDVGNPIGYLQATVELSLRDPTIRQALRESRAIWPTSVDNIPTFGTNSTKTSFGGLDS